MKFEWEIFINENAFEIISRKMHVKKPWMHVQLQRKMNRPLRNKVITARVPYCSSERALLFPTDTRMSI